MTRKMKAATILAASVAVNAAYEASAAVSLTGTSYSQNFDSLPSTSATSASSIGNFGTVIGAQFSITGLTSWDVAKVAGTGTTSSPLVYNADDGRGGSGSLNSYGSANSGERALGLLASASNAGGFGVLFTNDTSVTITGFTISYTAEQWRGGNTNTSTTATTTTRSEAQINQRLYFGYGEVGGTVTASNYLTATSGVTEVSTLDATSSAFATTQLDGNSAGNQDFITGAITGLSVAPGESLFIRWQDLNSAGNDNGIAVDDLSISFSAVPEPSALALLGLGAVGLMRRQRRQQRIDSR